jgi:hypothetical protein
LEAVKYNAYVLEFISAIFKNNQDFILKAVKINGLALEFASATF